MSPAILTETVWALSHESPPTVPDEVVVITTSKGRDQLRRELLTSRSDWGGKTVWEALRLEVFDHCNLPKNSPLLQLAIRLIELADPKSGIKQVASDLRCDEDNAAAADFILHTLGAYTEAADHRVVASIAGGRKTMGALLYAAMSLVGREGDRVTHVLVSDPYEIVPGFFFPGQPVQSLEAPSVGKPARSVQAHKARIEMADLPFVPLRNGFAELNEARRTFSGLVSRYSTELRRLPQGKPKVSIFLEQGTFVVEEKKIPLSGRTLLVAHFLHQRALKGLPHYPNAAAAESDYFKHFKEAKSRYWNLPKLSRYLGSSPAVDDIIKGLSDLREKLKKAGLTTCLSALAPERSRVGFDISATIDTPD